MLQWLVHQQAGTVHACLEATGIYGDAVAEALFKAGHTVSIVNPARIKGFAASEMIRTKTDKVDAGAIARFCWALRPEAWHPPAPELKRLQALVRRLDALQQMYRMERNRQEGAEAIVADSIQDHLRYLEEDIALTKQKIREHIHHYPDLK